MTIIIMTVTLIITRAPKPPPTVTATLLSSDATLNQNNYKLIVVFSFMQHTFTSSHKYGCAGSTSNRIRCSNSNRICGLTL